MEKDESKSKLTWHTYPDHLRETMQEMMTSGDFADVTLVSDDKRSIKAHRNVLSACSPVFKSILQLEPQHNHSVIYLRGIQHSQMKSILQFIYLGEATFYGKTMIDEFLLLGKDLQIKELMENNEYNQNPESTFENDMAEVEKQTEGIASIAMSNVEYQSEVEEEKSSETVHIKSQCPHCGNLYSCKRDLNRHIKSVHEGIKYPCNLCDYEANQQISLRSHVKSIHEGVRYECEHCDKEFSHKSDLTIHIKGKHEGFTYECDKCNQQFSKKRFLKAHIESKHEGIRYSCNQCEQQFIAKSSLQRHVASIHEEVKLDCNECDQQFRRRKSRQMHINFVHRGIMFSCDQCERQFKRKEHLVIHFQAKHEGIKYSCKHCFKQYTQEVNLQTHMKLKHP